MGTERRNTVTHVLKIHVDKSRVPHVCNLCNYKCESLGSLKGHRSWHSPHLITVRRAAANGKLINEDKMEYHGSNPVNLNKLIERVRNPVEAGKCTSY